MEFILFNMVYIIFGVYVNMKYILFDYKELKELLDESIWYEDHDRCGEWISTAYIYIEEDGIHIKKTHTYKDTTKELKLEGSVINAPFCQECNKELVLLRNDDEKDEWYNLTWFMKEGEPNFDYMKSFFKKNKVYVCLDCDKFYIIEHSIKLRKIKCPICNLEIQGCCCEYL